MSPRHPRKQVKIFEDRGAVAAKGKLRRDIESHVELTL
jgi:hypothetical protein